MPEPRQDMAFEYLHKEKILLTYAGPRPELAQWDRYLAALGELGRVSELRLVVWWEGPPPSADIRQRLTAATKFSWPCAFISSSAGMRFVISAFTLINRNLRFFTPAQLPQAFTHIRCNPAEAKAAEAMLLQLSQS